PIILVVNKVDHEKHENYDTEFTKLGLKHSVATSAEHSRGIGDLVAVIEELLPPEELSEEVAQEEVIPAIAIVGRPNVGKSSLINAVLRDGRTMVSPISGTTRDAVDVPYQRGDRHYVL